MGRAHRIQTCSQSSSTLFVLPRAQFSNRPACLCFAHLWLIVVGLLYSFANEKPGRRKAGRGCCLRRRRLGKETPHLGRGGGRYRRGGAIICYRRLFLINGLIALFASRERKVRITAPPHRRQRGRSSGPGKHNQRRSTKKSTKRRQRPSVHLCRQTATAQGVGLDREKKEEIGNEFKDYETKKEIGGHTTLQQGSLTP